MANKLRCYGCEQGHDEIAQVIACEGDSQRRILAELNAADEAEPKRDRRMLARNAGQKIGNESGARYAVRDRGPGITRAIRERYDVIDSQAGTIIDSYSSKKAATMHARDLNGK